MEVRILRGQPILFQNHILNRVVGQLTRNQLITKTTGRGRSDGARAARQGKAVRAMVRHEDERAQTLRDMGAEVVVGDLLDLNSMHR